MNQIKTEQKRVHEQKIVKEMIGLYCRKNHGTKNGNLCKECAELLDYAQKRAEKCPLMEQKTFCSACPVHCYRKEMREKIQTVMRFSGPRMLLYHPILAVWHLWVTICQKQKGKREK